MNKKVEKQELFWVHRFIDFLKYFKEFMIVAGIMGILVQTTILVILDKTLFFSRTQVPNDAFNIIVFSIPFFLPFLIIYIILNPKNRLERIVSIFLFIVLPVIFFLGRRYMSGNMEVVSVGRATSILVLFYNLWVGRKKKSLLVSTFKFLNAFSAIIMGLIFCTFLYRSISFKSFAGWYLIESDAPLLIQYFNDTYIILSDGEVRKNNDSVVLRKGRPGLRRELGDDGKYIMRKSFISEEEMKQ